MPRESQSSASEDITSVISLRATSQFSSIASIRVREKSDRLSFGALRCRSQEDLSVHVAK